MVTLDRLRGEYRDADEVVRQLAAAVVRRGASASVRSGWSAEAQDRVAGAVEEGTRNVIRWRVTHDSPHGLVARDVVVDAVAAISLRDRVPEIADVLGAPWDSVMRARGELRLLGSGAEEAALRLLPSWRLPVTQLAPAVAALLSLPTA